MKYQIKTDTGLVRVVDEDGYCYYGSADIDKLEGDTLRGVLGKGLLSDPLVGWGTENYSGKRTDFDPQAWLPHFVGLTQLGGITTVAFARYEDGFIRGSQVKVSSLVTSRHPHRRGFLVDSESPQIEITPFKKKLSKDRFAPKLMQSADKLSRLIDDSSQILAEARHKTAL